MVERMLSVAEVAERLGTTESHVRRLARSGALSAVKVGKLWRFHADDLEALVRPSGPPER